MEIWSKFGTVQDNVNGNMVQIWNCHNNVSDWNNSGK